jgi:hypothetical protein
LTADFAGRDFGSMELQAREIPVEGVKEFRIEHE